LKSKHTSLKQYTNCAKLIFFSLVLREQEEKKTKIFPTPRPILKERKDFKNYVEDLQDEIQASIRTVTPQSLGYDDDESTIVPVYLTSDLPELRRVPKDAGSGGPAPTLSTAENEIIDR
jgi:hypothetical protein